MFKKILKFILLLAPWFLTSIVFNDYSYFDSINLPFFTIPKFLFSIIWPILYILITISVFKVSNSNYFNLKEYKKDLIYNYIFNQLYTIIFFYLKNNFLAFIDVLLTLLTALFLYYETKEINKKASIYLIFYIIFLIYALILSISIYFINL
ncbi:MAG: tryptophan-rich sensory protein [Bacilli bacterium]|nr:tryptophan-rich sensory protein [Bacilli bacterium]